MSVECRLFAKRCAPVCRPRRHERSATPTKLPRARVHLRRSAVPSHIKHSTTHGSICSSLGTANASLREKTMWKLLGPAPCFFLFAPTLADAFWAGPPGPTGAPGPAGAAGTPGTPGMPGMPGMPSCTQTPQNGPGASPCSPLQQQTCSGPQGNTCYNNLLFCCSSGGKQPCNAQGTNFSPAFIAQKVCNRTGGSCPSCAYNTCLQCLQTLTCGLGPSPSPPAPAPPPVLPHIANYQLRVIPRHVDALTPTVQSTKVMFHLGWIDSAGTPFPMAFQTLWDNKTHSVSASPKSLCGNSAFLGSFVVAKNVIFSTQDTRIRIVFANDAPGQPVQLNLPTADDSSLMTMYDVCPWIQNQFPYCLGGIETVECISERIKQLTNGSHPLAPTGVKGYLLGGDNGYTFPQASTIIGWFKNYFADTEAKCCGTDGYLFTTPIYVVLGNHDYDHNGCGTNNMCPEPPAAGGEYMGLGLASGSKEWYDSPSDLCACTSRECGLPNTYGGGTAPVDWSYTFGAYVHGAVGVITWDGRWDPKALLNPANSNLTSALQAALQNFERAGVGQLWVQQHWSGNDHGAAQPMGCTYVASTFQAYSVLQGLSVANLHWYSFCGHTHVSAGAGPRAQIIGNNGYNPGQPCPTVIAARTDYEPSTQVDTNCVGFPLPNAASVSTYTNGYSKTTAPNDCA